MFASGVGTADAQDLGVASVTSDLRVGVLALADAIASVGRTPDLAEPLPYTRTSIADVLQLDDVVTTQLITAMAGTDLKAALEQVRGITDVVVDGTEVSFAYAQTVRVPLELAYDDGDMRFGPNSGAGSLTVTLATPAGGERFVVQVDETQLDPLLRFALVSEPELELTVDINTDEVEAFPATEGFTEIDVTGGHYRIHREADITLRDPNGRGLLTLEDLRYSNLVDLYRIERNTGVDNVDIAFDVELPSDVADSGASDGTPRAGTRTLLGSALSFDVWPDPADPADTTEIYGSALAALTDLSLVDGISSLAEYTGTALVLQDAADVDFPNLGGGITDLFAPADELLDMLATSAVAEIRCGLTPDNPPNGTGAPGDTVYCDAVTATGLPDVTAAAWSVADTGNVASADATTSLTAVGDRPTGTVRIDGSDGQPDVVLELTLGDGTTMTARPLPRTIQDVTGRITELDTPGGRSASSGATVNLDVDGSGADRLDVTVALGATGPSADLPVGDPATLGALVGLTGLTSPSGEPATATAKATDASFDVGFGIPLDAPAADVTASIDLLPADSSLFTVATVDADPPTDLDGLTGRIGFLGVNVDITELTLGGGTDTSNPVVALSAPTAEAINVSDLLTDEGTLASASGLTLASKLTASIGFKATEQPLPGTGGFATGETEATSGVATVSWTPGGLPAVSLDAGYGVLRVFDPVPAVFLSGKADVTKATTTYEEPAGTVNTVDADTVELDITGLGTSTLYAELGVGATAGIEVARRLVGAGVSCQNVTIVDVDTLTCEGLAPGGTAAFENGATVEVIVLGDPFALRDGIIDGLAVSLNEFQRLAGDNVPEDEDFDDDQYTSTLALVDLVPSQLAVEREDLADTLGAIVAAATADEVGTSSGPSVSSAQELSAFATARPETSLGFSVGTATLDVSVATDAPVGTALLAPLRFPVAGTGQVLSEGLVTVGVVSSTTLATKVAVATARPGPSELAGSTSTATLGTTSELEGLLRAGAGVLTVTPGSTVETADPRSTATLGVTVETSRTNAADDLTTGRSGDGAAASLVVTERDGPLAYEADPWDSSGGSGASQPAPEPMQVKFLAEGLDGLASALDGALDGASARVTGPSGVPVAAPLIGSDLDAGADVAGVLTELTSALRDELETTAVTGAATAAELEAAVTTAVTDALAAAPDDVSGTAPAVTVTCDDCLPQCADGQTESCSIDGPIDGPTVWHSVSVTTTLTGKKRTGKTEFSIGLAGVNVRSDQPIDTETSWTLPIELALVRGVGPQITIASEDTLELGVSAALPAADKVSPALGAANNAATCRSADHAQCIPAIIGYLPGMLTTTNTKQGSMDTTVSVALPDGDFDLFELYDGIDATPTFVGDRGKDKAEDEGLKLGFETVASEYGSFDLTGTINVPWTADGGTFQANDPKTTDGGFEEVTYTEVKLDVGEVIATLATPFDVIDPYLAPVRDVIDVLRTPIPVVSDISELGGGDEISLLSIVEDLQGGNPKLDLAIRITNFIETVVTVVGAVAAFAAEGGVHLDELSKAGALLTVEPSEVELSGSCTETVSTTKTTTTTPPADGTVTATPKPKKTTAACPDEPTNPGARKQTTAEKRRGTRTTATSVGTKTKGITGSAPGFSVPFLADPDQIVDVLTGEGEATYFRLDLGTLVAEVAYSRKFGPIMAGPVPIVPFVGGSISLEGRMAAGFDSMPQTLAVRSVPAGDIGALIAGLDSFDGGDIIREGFYLDDLDAEGVDVPEIKLVTTIEAGAGVSIGIVSAGLKGGVTLTINIDMNDPNDDGKIRTAEIRTMFAGNPACLFDVSATLQAFLQIFVEIELFVTTKKYAWDLVRLGPYKLFEYGCPDVVPTLVVADGDNLALTSGSRNSQRNAPALSNRPENYEVRQFDAAPGGARVAGGTTTYEIDAIDRVQRVVVAANASGGGGVATIYKSGVALSTTVQATVTITDLSAMRFLADGNDPSALPEGANTADDLFSFLLGETFDANGNLVSTRFTTPVTLDGRGGADTLVTGDGDDRVTGGAGNDGISAGAGNDVAGGGADDDLVDGGIGHDDLNGGTGHDRLEGGPGADRISGDAGNDAIIGGTGRDVRALLLDDGTGDIPSVQDQVDVGFDSGDVLVGGPGGDVVDGGDGSDVVVGGDASALTGVDLATLFGTVTDGREVNVLNKTSRAITTQDVDIYTATVQSDETVDGLCVSGTEEAFVAGGGDVVTGGPEADVVVGGNGADDLDGGGGPDQACGRAGDDNISGDGGAPPADAGDDVVRGGHGNDIIDTGLGDDHAYGDDADLYRVDALDDTSELVLDGTLGTASTTGDGNDYITTGDGDDLIAGGGGSDLLRGGAGDDRVYGEAADTADTADVGGDAPTVADRMVACNPATRIVNGAIDLNGDLLAGATTIDGAESDVGRLAGLEVTAGVLHQLGTTTTFTGLIGGEIVVIEGLVDLDRDGKVGVADTDGGDTGTVGLASMMATTATNADGDCILGEDGDDDLRGGLGSDHIAAGAGTDLVTGGDGNDLLLGDAGTDVITGGPHHDVLVGGDGDDHLVGGQGDDRLRGNNGDDDLIGGTDADSASDGQDVLLGGRGFDVLAGENATVVSAAIVAAIDGASWVNDAIVPTATRAGDQSVFRNVDGAVTCDANAPDRWVTLLDGAAGEVRDPADSPGGPVLYDELFGGFGCDWVFGQEGDDLVRGGQDDDVVEGGPGDDTGYGDAGHDVVIGGSSVDQSTAGAIVTGRSGAGAPDGNDTLFGDGGPDGLVGDDVIVGDNATPVFIQSSVPEALPAIVGADPLPAIVQIVLADVPLAGAPIDPLTVFGHDIIDADGGDDRVFGQSGIDTINGGAGEDYLEGNAGADTLSGQDDDDVILGGSRTAGIHDDGDQLFGGGGADLVLGDNALVTIADDDPVDMAVVLHDVPGLDDDGLAIPGGDTAGNDLVWGDDGPGDDTGTAMADRIYGQADDDTIHGQVGDDDLQGNAGDDAIYGEDGNDRIVGGSASDQSGTDGADLVFSDVADGDDDLAGGAGTDWIAGDNAVISTDGAIQQADIRVLAETLPGSGVAGDDLIYGDLAPGGVDLSTGAGDVDVLRGQSGDDTVHGQVGDDDIEGNAGADTIYGHDGDDDIVGGSRRAGVDDGEVGTSGDWISGGAGTDWIAGDNALLERHAVGTVELLDVPVAGADPQPHPDAAGGDVIFGDSAGNDSAAAESGATDTIYGQSGDDLIDGQAGDDVIDGNAGGDTISGGGGDDALVGGSSADDDTSEKPTAGPGAERRLLAGVVDDVGDTISGGPGVDVILGDNGVIAGHGTEATWRLHDVDVAGQTGHADPGVAGPDVLSGDPGTDVVLGQGGNDRLSGGPADDSVHGGPGDDVIQGDGGADDLVGGSSHHWVEAAVIELRTVVDGADLLFGNAPTGDCAVASTGGIPNTDACDESTTDPGDEDLGDTIIGDNGRLTRDGGADARLLEAGLTRDDTTGDPIRSILLYDVDVVDVATFDLGASGADIMFGAAGRDRLSGQAGNDVLFGQAGDDEIEGNGGADTIVGSDGSDDLIGGSSSDVLGLVHAGGFPGSGTDVADGDDTVFAGDGDDVALGDNGIIQRPTDSRWLYHDAPYGHVKRSRVEVAFAFEKTGAFGGDTIHAGAGHDEVHGQLGDDTLHGQEGDDTLIGDLGHLIEYGVVAGEDPRSLSETIQANALDEPVFRPGSLYRSVELFETVGSNPEVSTSLRTGNDTITGGAGNDAIHAGSGDDIVNGHGDIADDDLPGKGADVAAVAALDAACAEDLSYLSCDEDDVFGGHGKDQVWGGPGHDRLFGGHDADELDVIRAGSTVRNPDVDYVGIDLMFGGWGPDVMQADRSVNGPDAGDRMIDSAGAYNAYFVCGGGLGDVTAIRRMSPAILTFLDEVAIAAGAFEADTRGKAGFWALANIFKKDVNANTNPVHPENPGNFVCNETPPDPEPTGPVAAFSWACTNLSCAFTDESKSSLTDPGWMYAWDFGDGTMSTEQNATRVFSAAGRYQVELTVTAGGVPASVSQHVQVGVVEPVPIVLTAVGSKVKGVHVVALTWSGASGTLDVWRDTQLVGESLTGTAYRDEPGTKGSASYTYRVCEAVTEAGSEARCSPPVTVTF